MTNERRDQWRSLPRPPSSTETLQVQFRLTAPDRPVTLEALERSHILSAINWAGGNKTLAARALGIDRRTLHRKLAKYEGKVG